MRLEDVIELPEVCNYISYCKQLALLNSAHRGDIMEEVELCLDEIADTEMVEHELEISYDRLDNMVKMGKLTTG